jgi:hypothetical protein
MLLTFVLFFLFFLQLLAHRWWWSERAELRRRQNYGMRRRSEWACSPPLSLPSLTRSPRSSARTGPAPPALQLFFQKSVTILGVKIYRNVGILQYRTKLYCIVIQKLHTGIFWYIVFILFFLLSIGVLQNINQNSCIPWIASLFFIRPSKDGTYYVMALSVHGHFSFPDFFLPSLQL